MTTSGEIDYNGWNFNGLVSDSAKTGNIHAFIVTSTQFARVLARSLADKFALV